MLALTVMKGHTGAARVVTSAAYGGIRYASPWRSYLLFFRMHLLYEKCAVPALESDCKRIPQIRDHFFPQPC